MIRSPSRRRFAVVLGQWAAALVASRPGAAAPSDRGIGGTGATPDPEQPPRDRGIGGTGVVGTITGFGSIIVNGLRIAYPKDVAVVIDGAPAPVSALRIGHVVTVLATPRHGGLTTRRIAVMSEVIGPVEAMASDHLTVMGQQVLAPPGTTATIGDFVAVSGLRQADGTVVATLIEPRPAAKARVTGLVGQGADGTPTIAGLRLRDVDRARIGTRCVVEGHLDADGLDVESATDERALLAALGSRHLLVEAFVSRVDGGVALGSGLPVAAASVAASVAAIPEKRGLISLTVSRTGDLSVRSVTPSSGARAGTPPSRPADRPAAQEPGHPSAPSGHPSGAAPGGPGGRGGANPGGHGRR